LALWSLVGLSLSTCRDEGSSVADLFARVATASTRRHPLAAIRSAANLFDHLSFTTGHDTPAAGAVDFNSGSLATLGSKPTFVRGDKFEFICHYRQRTAAAKTDSN
jgi:hypothetical protein